MMMVYEIGMVNVIERHRIKIEYPIDINGFNFAQSIKRLKYLITILISIMQTATIAITIQKNSIYGIILQQVKED